MSCVYVGAERSELLRRNSLLCDLYWTYGSCISQCYAQTIRLARIYRFQRLKLLPVTLLASILESNEVVISFVAVLSIMEFSYIR